MNMFVCLLVAVCGVCVGQRPPQCGAGRACMETTSVEAATDFLYEVTGKEEPLVISLANGKFSLDCQSQNVSDAELPSFARPTSFSKLMLRRCFAGDVLSTLRALNVSSTRLSLQQCKRVRLSGLKGFTSLHIAETEQVLASEIYEMGVMYLVLNDVTLTNVEKGLGVGLVKLDVGDVRGVRDVALSGGLKVLRTRGEYPPLEGVADNVVKLHMEGVERVVLPRMPMLEELELVSVRSVSGWAEVPARLHTLLLIDTAAAEVPWSGSQHLRQYTATSASLSAVPPLGPAMSRLSLSHNTITQWPPMPPMANLTHIDLSHNRIQQLNASLLPASLRAINLAYNKFTKITERELEYRSEEVDVDMSGNNITDIECERCGTTGVTITLTSVYKCGGGGGGATFVGGRCQPSEGDACPPQCVCHEHELRCPHAGLTQWPPLPLTVRHVILPHNNLTYIPPLPPTLTFIDLNANPLQPAAAEALLSFKGDTNMTCHCDALLERLIEGRAERIHCQGEGDIGRKMRACRAGEGGAAAGVGAGIAVASLALAGALAVYYACRRRVKRALAQALHREDWSLPLDATVWAPVEEGAWCRQVCGGLRGRGLKVQCGAEQGAGEYLPARMAEGVRGARRTVLLAGGAEGAEGIARRRAKECQMHRVIEVRRGGGCALPSRHTCLLDDDPHFWEKLMKAMPTHHNQRSRIFTIA